MKDYFQHIIAGAILFLLGLGLAFLPEKQSHREISPQQINQELSQEERYITVDEVADRLVQNDPALLLVDLRAPEEYERFSLPGAINIPLEKILAPESEEYLGRKELDVVFYCNDGIKSELAWQVRQRALKNKALILKGGLNQWAYDIFIAPLPDETASAMEIERHRFHQAVRTYLTGGSRPFSNTETAPAEAPAPKPAIQLRPRIETVEKTEEEGC